MDDEALATEQPAPQNLEAPGGSVMDGIAAGIAPQEEPPSIEDMLTAPSRSRIPFREAMRALGEGDLDGLEGIHFTRGKNTGRAIATFNDEFGEPFAIHVPDSTVFALAERRGNARAARKMLEAQARQDAATQQRINKVMAINRTPSAVQGVVAALAARNPSKALESLMQFEKQRALGKPVVNEATRMMVELADEDQKARLVTYAGQMSRMRMAADKAQMVLMSHKAGPSERAEAANVLQHFATLRAAQYGGKEFMATGGAPVGYISWAMHGDQDWSADGGPLQRLMALAASSTGDWEPIPKPTRADQLPAYINSMNAWVQQHFGWRGLAITPQEQQILASQLGKLDPRFELEMQARQSLDMQDRMTQLENHVAAATRGPAPQQRGAPETVEPQGRAPSIAGQLFESGAVQIKNAGNPSEEDLNKLAAEFSKRGVKDPEQLAALIEEYLSMAEAMKAPRGKPNANGSSKPGTRSAADAEARYNRGERGDRSAGPSFANSRGG